jgi:hypothetical protein
VKPVQIDRSRTVVVPSRRAAARAAVAALVLLAAACGGGGGGGNDGGGTTPTPRPGSSATPQPTAVPTPTPLTGPHAKVIMSENDTVAGLGVLDIQDAGMNNAGAVEAIISVRGTNGARAVLQGDTGGNFTSLLDPSAPPDGDDLKTLARVRLAETGAGIFQSGSGLDSDRLYFASDGTVQPIAGAAPGMIAPTFRVLGDVVLGGGGTVGFVGGGDPCTSDTTAANPRPLCTIHLFVADDGTASEVGADAITVTNTSPTRPQVAVTDSGVAFFSVPGSGDAPVLVRVDKGQLETLLKASSSLPNGIGRLVSPQVSAVNASEQLLLTTTLASDTAPRPTVLALFANGNFTVLEREGDPAGDQVITNLRSVGLDDKGHALYLVRIGAVGATDAPRTLRLSDAQTPVDIATEGASFLDTGKTLLSIASQRINRHGDVAFVAQLGHSDGLTTVIDEIRAVVRRADGTYVTPLSSAKPEDIGTVTNITIAGFDDNANLLLITTRTPSQTLLIFAPPVTPQ